MESRRCAKCNELKSCSEFYANKSQSGGLDYYCKVCKKISISSSRSERTVQRSRERSRERMRRLRISDPELQKENTRASYRKHAESRKLKQIAYNHDHAEERRIKAREYRLKNLLTIRAREAEKNARRYAVEGSFTKEEIQSKLDYQCGNCYWCKLPHGENYQLDHIVPLAKGGTNWSYNIAISCKRCNHRKKDKMPDEWLKVLPVYLELYAKSDKRVV